MTEEVTPPVATAPAPAEGTAKRRRRIALKRAFEDEKPKAPTAPQRAAKRTKRPRKTAPATSSDEIPDEDIPTWDGWKEMYFVGTEWENYEKIFSVTWNFDHLREEMESGELFHGKQVYLFGTSEPQMVHDQMTLVPAIVAVVGDGIPPPTQLGITSVVMGTEKFKNIADLKIGWTPFYLNANEWRSRKGEKKKRDNIYFLHCSQRRTLVKKMKTPEMKEYEYAMLYFARPDELLKDNAETEVSGIVTLGGKRAISYSFDYTTESLKEYVEGLMEDEGVEENFKDEITNTIKEHVTKLKAKIQEEKEKKKKEYDAIPEKLRNALNSVVTYKFYPKNKNPDLEALALKSTFINRYFRHAQKVM